MNEDERGRDDSSNGKGNKKDVRWPEYFAWMVKIAEKYVGENDAKDVANAALYDFCCSDRQRPSADNRKETEYLLRYLVKQRARALWKQQKRRGPEVLSSFDHDEPHPEFAQANHDDQVFDRLELERMLAHLSMVERQLVVGFYVDGLTAEELARKHKMKPNTVNSQIRRMLPRLARTLTENSRQVSRSSGILFLLVWKEEQLQMLRLAWTTIRERVANIANWMRALRSLAYCAPLAVLPGHALADEGPEETPPTPEASQSSPMSDWPSMMLGVAFDLTVARRDEALPEISQAARVVGKIPAPETPLSTHVAEVDSTEAKETLSIEPIEAPPVNDCHNQLGLALAKKNAEEFESCVEVLVRVRRSDAVCGQSLEWRLLNESCRRR